MKQGISKEGVEAVMDADSECIMIQVLHDRHTKTPTVMVSDTSQILVVPFIIALLIGVPLDHGSPSGV